MRRPHASLSTSGAAAWALAACLIALACCTAPPAAAPSESAGADIAEPGAPAIEMPGPARGRREQAAALNAECERCHAPEAREWRASLHREADLVPAYRRAFAIEPMPFCRSCHAPEANPEEPESDAVAAIGVGCVTCHVTGSAVLAAPLRNPASPALSPHPIVRDARFAGDGACAGCHEFGFPSTPGRETRDKMQWTMTEHARSAAADVPCAGCHMPLERGRRSHTFAASRDPAMLARAAHITAERDGPSSVRITLAPAEAGHAFPTGDLFRRIEVLAQIDGPDHMVLGSDVQYLGRHFERRGAGSGRRLVRDDRLFGAPVTVTLSLGPDAAGRPIAYRVAYQRIEHPVGTGDEAAVLEGETVLAQGILHP
jgi:hypothetical protein